MPGIIGHKSVKHRRGRRQNVVPVKATPIGVVASNFAGSTCTITFDQPVSLDGVPAYLNQADAPPTVAVATGPATIELTYAGAVTSVTIPFQDPAVRNSSGGYVTPTSAQSP